MTPTTTATDATDGQPETSADARTVSPVSNPEARQFRSQEQTSSVLPWVLSGSGVLLIAAHVPHFGADLANDVGAFAIASGVIAPLILSFGIVVAGIELRRSTLDRHEIRRVCAWTLLGAGFLVAVGGVSYVYQLTEGAVLTHVNYVLGNFITGGALAGFIVGWFDAHGHLRREELRGFLEAVEHTGHAVCITRTDGTIEYVNDAFVDQTGYSRAAALGATPRLVNSGEQPDEFYADLWSTILDGEVWRGELVNRRADGTYYHVDQTIAPVVDGQGCIERFVAINAEITDLKEYEGELERQNEQLEQFASILSHDLRNPLNVAMGRVDLLAAETDCEHVPPVRAALERMDRLVTDVHHLTRTDATDHTMDTLNVAAVARSAWTSVDTRDATLHVEDPGVVEASETQLRQLLENLFRNSVEHGSTNPRSRAHEDSVEHGSTDNRDAARLDDAVEHRGRAVTIAVDGLSDGFYVADDGPGIPVDERDTVFESGYTTSEEGTGLGLEIVSRIADVHGWEVSVTESDAGGARFEFRSARGRETVEDDDRADRTTSVACHH